MIGNDTVTECRVVRGFDRVYLQVDNTVNEVTIRQGERESLIITGRPGILSSIMTEVRDGRLSVTLGGGWTEKLGRALTTSLTRQWVRCDLTVRRLTSLELGGLVRVRASGLVSDRLSVNLMGAGMVNVDSLTAQLLDVTMRGTCQMNVTGRAVKQRITMEGMGSYTAPKLKSRSTVVELRGAGRVTVWAVEDLDVTSRGLGSVEYRGTPRVMRHTSPLASVVRMGAPIG